MKPAVTLFPSSYSVGVLHFLGEQLSHGKLVKYDSLCTSSYNFENFIQKFDQGQKLLMIFVFCLFERNCRLFFQSTGDSCHRKIGNIS